RRPKAAAMWCKATRRTSASRCDALGPPRLRCMKAVVCRQFGGPGVARLEDVAPPPLFPGAVRIEVRACSASFASLLVMAGRHQNRAELPLIPGTEIAGIVTELDAGVTRFRIGDRVIAGVHSGGYAQEAVAPEQTVFHL